MLESYDSSQPAPDYDDILESALNKLDDYQARRADMDKHLKTVNLSQPLCIIREADLISNHRSGYCAT